MAKAPPHCRPGNHKARSPTMRRIKPNCINKTGPYKIGRKGTETPLTAGKMIRA